MKMDSNPTHKIEILYLLGRPEPVTGFPGGNSRKIEVLQGRRQAGEGGGGGGAPQKSA